MNLKIMEAMEYMDEKYIGEALEAEKKASNRKVLKRWGAIAACLVLVVGLCLGFLGGKEEIVLPPSRYGANAGQLSIYCPSFEEAWDAADVIAWVRVGNWLGERSGDKVLDTTYFEAEVIRTYKGNPGESIVLEQVGSSNWTVKCYPLFTYGNEMLLFLQGGDSRPFPGNHYTGAEFDNSYCIVGTYGGVMDVVTNTDGTVYVTDRFGFITKDVESYSLNSQILQSVKPELCNVLSTVDTIQQTEVRNSKRMFTLEQMEKLFGK